MKKVILSLAILVATSAAAFAAGDNKGEVKSNCCQTTCTSPENCVPGKQCTPDQACTPNQACTPGKRGERCGRAFEGLGLTTEQQTKLAELRKSCQENCNAGANDRKDGEKRGKLTDEQKKQLRAEYKTKRLESRKKFLDGVKSILTPEQYNKFLENSYLSRADKHKSGKMHGKRYYGKREGKRDARHNGKRDCTQLNCTTGAV